MSLAGLSRPLLSSIFLLGAYNQFKNTDALAPAAGKFLGALPSSPPLSGRAAVQINAAVMALGGAGLALGIAPRLCSAALIGALAPTTYVGHPFWEQDDPMGKMRERNAFFSNTAIIGGLLHVLATPSQS